MRLLKHLRDNLAHLYTLADNAPDGVSTAEDVQHRGRVWETHSLYVHRRHP